jgi:DNA polymerase I
MAPIGEIETAVAATREAMAKASHVVLNGFEVRTDAKVTRYPDRFSDPRGKRMWNVVTRLIEEAEAVATGRWHEGRRQQPLPPGQPSA